MLLRLLAGASLALGVAAVATAATWSQDWNAVGRLRVEYSQDVPFFAGSGGDVVAGNFDSRLAAYGAGGSQRWVVAGAGSTSYLSTDDFLLDAAVDADGSAWMLTGESSGSPYTALTRIGADGQAQWSRPVPGIAVTGVAGGAIVVGAGWNYSTTIATKFNADGGIAWQRRMPAVGNDVTIAAAADGGAFVAQSVGLGRMLLTRLDADGRVIRSQDQIVNTVYRPSLRASSTALYFVTNKDAYAFDPATLAPRWSRPACGTLDIVPAGAANAGDAVCAGDDALVRLAVADGQARWSVPLDGGYYAKPVRATASGLLVAVAGTLRGIDPATGAQRWSLAVTNAESGSAVAGIGVEAAGRVGVAYADCAAGSAGCTVAFKQVSVDAGVAQNTVTVENAALDAVGASLREGDDVVSAVSVPGGTAASVRVRVNAAADGAQRWAASYAVAPYYYIYGTSVVAGSDYVAVALSFGDTRNRMELRSSGSAGIVVFDRATGAQRWVGWFGGADRGAFEPPSLAVDAQDQLVLGTSYLRSTLFGRDREGEMLRIAAADGAVKWRVPVWFDLTPDVRRLGDDLVAGVHGGVSRVALSDGHTVWTAAGASLGYERLATLSGNDFIVFGNSSMSNAPTVSRLDYATGAVKWQRGYGDGVRRYLSPIGRVLANGDVAVVGGWFVIEQTPYRSIALRKPYSLRLDAATGNVAGYRDRAIGATMSGLFSTSNVAADGRWWGTESRRVGNESGLTTTWLTELDAAGQPLGSQALRSVTYSDVQRRSYEFPLAAPQADRLLGSGFAIGGNTGQGLTTSVVDTAVTATGDLAVTLDPVSLARPGKPLAYGARVTWSGTAPVAARLTLQLPWSEAGTVNACTVTGGTCTIDTRNGWLEATLQLPPGGTMRLTGTLIARDLDGTYGAMLGGPMFLAMVTGGTGLRETAIDNNHAFAQAAMSLFANGFE